MIVDGHEDLALNVLADGRDYLTSACAIHEVEAAAGIESGNGLCMLGLADLGARPTFASSSLELADAAQAGLALSLT